MGWIRVLVVVLALTASRNNFPLFKYAWSPSPATPVVLSVQTGNGAKASEGVTPSRRNVETRRTDYLQPLVSDSYPQPILRDNPSNRLDPFGIGLRPDTERDSGRQALRPGYLHFLLTPQQRSLPPPA